MTETVHQLLFSLRGANGTEQVIPFVDVGRGLSRASQNAGIKHVHLHMLRHTFATRLRDRGVPLDRIMELMGHKSMEMVLRYAKARPQQLVDAIHTLNVPSPQLSAATPGVTWTHTPTIPAAFSP